MNESAIAVAVVGAVCGFCGFAAGYITCAQKAIKILKEHQRESLRLARLDLTTKAVSRSIR